MDIGYASSCLNSPSLVGGEACFAFGVAAAPRPGDGLCWSVGFEGWYRSLGYSRSRPCASRILTPRSLRRSLTVWASTPSFSPTRASDQPTP
jgi:hypothetical protein